VYANINNQFKQIADEKSQCWVLQTFILKKDTILLASTENGLFEITNTRSKLIQPEYGFAIHQSKINPHRIYLGMNDGLISLKYENKRWVNEGYFQDIKNKIQNIEEDAQGNLWLGTPVNGIIKVNFYAPFQKIYTTPWHAKYSIQNFDTTHGLPNMDNNIPFAFKNTILFGTNDGLYQFNEKQKHLLNLPYYKKN